MTRYILSVLWSHVLCCAIALLHVEKRGFRNKLVDSLGRERLLQGINLATIGGNRSAVPISPALYEHGGCPDNNEEWYQPPICASDIAQLKASGFDVVRLLVHWAHIEPAPGKYSTLYFQRINQIIDWADENDVYVLIDFHQDNFANESSVCCADDGAPAWAWLVNDSLLTPAERIETLVLHKLVPQLDWSGAEVAFQSFWQNKKVPATGRGLQEHYIQALAHMVNATMHRPRVIGWEIMNEPLPGLDINPFDFASHFLYPFYSKTIQAITGVRDGLSTCPCEVQGLELNCPPGETPISDKCAYPDLGLHIDKLVVFEPMAVRNQLDVSLQISKPFSEYRNLVYAPHTYTRSFTVWNKAPYFLSLESALAEADRMHAALMVTEWGGPHLNELRNISEYQQQHMVNAIHWVWKQNGNGGWSLHSPNGTKFSMRTDRLNVASHIRPRAIAGELLSYSAQDAVFRMSARCAQMSTDMPKAFTEVYFPSHHVGCLKSSEPLYVSGSAHLDKIEYAKDGSATAFIMCDDDGEFHALCTGKATDTQHGTNSSEVVV